MIAFFQSAPGRKCFFFGLGHRYYKSKAIQFIRRKSFCRGKEKGGQERSKFHGLWHKNYFYFGLIAEAIESCDLRSLDGAAYPGH